MFEKIGDAAEKLATNVSESRRGFLSRVGQAALGVTAVVAGVLASPSEAQAIVTIKRGCVIDYSGNLNGACVDKSSGVCKTCYGCPSGVSGGFSALFICGSKISTRYTCKCS
jgi:hypothetical protein